MENLPHLTLVSLVVSADVAAADRSEKFLVNRDLTGELKIRGEPSFKLLMANTDFHLQFQDFGDDADLMAGSTGSTRITIDDHTTKPQKQRRVAGVAEEDETDPLESDDTDKLLSGQKKNAPFWTFEYYQTFFDVDTSQVKDRIIGSVVPWPGKNFVRFYIRNNPDLYGPFWICATLVFAVAVSGNICSFLVNHGQPQYKYVPEFRKVTIAATAIFSYAWFVPLAVWGFLMWRNSKISLTVSYSFLEIVCVYGYSLSIYIPAVVLWIIPSEPLRWCSINFGSLSVGICADSDVLASNPGRPPTHRNSGHFSHCSASRFACCWLQGIFFQHL
ncbi:hypothetical protein SRHO_G00209530 [Serrasalmus rhombeus]